MGEKELNKKMKSDILESENPSGTALIVLKELLFGETKTSVWLNIGKQMDELLVELGNDVRSKLMYYVNAPDFYSNFSYTDDATAWIGELSIEKGKLLVSFMVTKFGSLWKGDTKKSLKWFRKFDRYTNKEVIEAVKKL